MRRSSVLRSVASAHPLRSSSSLLPSLSSSLSHSTSLLHASPFPSLTLPPSSSYHERVIDHYENPRNVGSMNPSDPNVGTGLVGAPACGDVMKLQLRVDDRGMIVEAKFKTFGCGSAIASSSLATTMAKGKSVDEVLKIKNSEIAKHLSLPPVKLHCSMLAEDAIKAAVKDYQSKKQQREAGGQAHTQTQQPLHATAAAAQTVSASA